MQILTQVSRDVSRCCRLIRFKAGEGKKGGNVAPHKNVKVLVDALRRK